LSFVVGGVGMAGIPITTKSLVQLGTVVTLKTYFAGNVSPPPGLGAAFIFTERMVPVLSFPGPTNAETSLYS
jgi:hypothetical protein